MTVYISIIGDPCIKSYLFGNIGLSNCFENYEYYEYRRIEILVLYLLLMVGLQSSLFDLC